MRLRLLSEVWSVLMPRREAFSARNRFVNFRRGRHIERYSISIKSTTVERVASATSDPRVWISFGQRRRALTDRRCAENTSILRLASLAWWFAASFFDLSDLVVWVAMSWFWSDQSGSEIRPGVSRPVLQRDSWPPAEPEHFNEWFGQP